MGEGNVILYDEFLQANFTPEEIVYWFSNGCWDAFCIGDCIDPTCAKKFFNKIDKEQIKNRIKIKDSI